jgi:hypothetical protein
LQDKQKTINLNFLSFPTITESKPIFAFFHPFILFLLLKKIAYIFCDIFFDNILYNDLILKQSLNFNPSQNTEACSGFFSSGADSIFRRAEIFSSVQWQNILVLASVPYVTHESFFHQGQKYTILKFIRCIFRGGHMHP